MSSGLFITFEGTEGAGKSTQIASLAERLRLSGREVLTLREPGGTPIGEEIRHLVKHSDANHAMTPEAELLLMCASRAQLVREVIRPTLQRGTVVLCDRFFDSTVAYQGYGRGLDLEFVARLTEFVIGPNRPDLTLLLTVPITVSEERRRTRQTAAETPRDRMEEADRAFFERVETGFQTIASQDSSRVKSIDASLTREQVAEAIWGQVCGRLK